MDKQLSNRQKRLSQIKSETKLGIHSDQPDKVLKTSPVTKIVDEICIFRVNSC